MLNTASARRGMVVAPHHLAAQAGLSVLRDGGTAVEAMVAAAAAVAVVYPHMNGIGGDGFWLIAEPGKPPVGIDASGAAAAAAVPDLYRGHGHAAIPARGPLAANTVAGTLSGWGAALATGRDWPGARLPLSRLLEDAVHYARDGVPATGGQVRLTAAKRAELETVPGFAPVFLPGGSVPAPGARFRQPDLAASLERIATAGVDDFYRGDLARAVAAGLERAGSPVALADLEAHRARTVRPLGARLRNATLYNMTPPTQGLASLMILALFDRLGVARADGFDHVHGLVEATKQAFLVRDRHVTDPARMTADPADFLTDAALADRAGRIDPARAMPWPRSGPPADTIWMGAIDGAGRAVSFIQSTYWEFGSGVVAGDTGILWQNRGSSFSLDPNAVNALVPGMRPFHTLNPALARFDDGRVMPYGTMGGEGQPQTQAAVFSRYGLFGQELQRAVTAPRWLLGRTWGADSTNLKLEARFDPEVVEALRSAGHDVEVVEPFSDMMGHAGALVLHPDGTIEGASDCRSDGAVAAF
ncbi:gamma-glutamyltransferase family protein [Skermanella rosea]|uniref:gamma-glutamyltransferase family protein n=1 Tax=Skermanella rosea TaxID=1817965 RepID=UPI00193211E7|nr:gamma-glutamyltransferase family protein [Skermanella rosea]UEM03985.1 gamma-glutamyltransferase family protein [Skermanella rosea]